MSNTEGNRNNKRLTFSDAKSHCANVGRLANATLHHYSESSEHSRNSLGRRSTCYLHRLKTLINVFDSCSWEYRLKHVNHQKIRCTHCLTKGCHIVQFRINLAQWWEFQHWCASTANVIKTHNHLQ